jgi:hypothetical protein
MPRIVTRSPMKRFCMSLAAVVFLLIALPALAITRIPPASGTALDGHAVLLPRDLPGRATILILGFSQHSADATTVWEKSIRTSLANSPSVGYLDMPFLEDAPSFIRPLIVRSIRKQVPPVLHPYFVPLTSGQAAWKQLTGFTASAADAAYVLLVDRNGEVLWQTHEAFSQARFDELASAARKLAASN